MKKVDEESIKKRIKKLEADIEKANLQIEEATRMKISMQGGIIELKKLLEQMEQK